jgi:signal transduction histidine kinase
MSPPKKNQIELSPIFKHLFEEETKGLLVSRTYYLFLITSILYPCFSVLDWITAPDHALLFLYIRLAVGANFIICALLLKLPIGKKIALPISLWGGYVPILGVAIMTVYLNGFLSDYYVGIVLIIFIPGLFLPWNLFATIIYGSSSIATYFFLNFTIGSQPSLNLTTVAGPFFFMTWSFLYMAFANVEKEKTRRQDFMLRIQIEKANEDLKELDKTKMRFFANVSHELRTPLTLIIGPLEQLLQGWNDMDPVPMLRAMEANAHRLLRQVNTILNFAKVDAGKLTCHYKNGNLGKILSELVQASIPYSRQKNIEMTISGTDEIPDTAIDIEKVETIAANLISNALKFTSDKGKISICTGRDKQVIWFEVQDTGMGIPEDKIDNIFERFHQVDDQHSRNNEGTGLGLAMVRELTLLHGGKVNVRSKIGKGSVFRVELPMKPLSPESDRRKRAGRRKFDKIAEERLEALMDKEYQERVKIDKKTLFADVARGSGLGDNIAMEYIDKKKSAPSDAQKILVVEDNPDLRAFIVSNLFETYLVEQAENGRLGLDLARRMNPDLIISDVMMPEMDGYELCREIRKDPFLSKVPIILVTSKSGGEAVEAGLEIGATDYVPKPFEMRELKARIATHLKNRFLEKNINERETRLTAIGQMTSAVVHDLKNPLNTIIGFTQIAKQDSEALEEKGISKNLSHVMESSVRLTRMIAEILDFARGYAPRLNTESTVLIPFLETTLGNHRIKLNTMGISLISGYEDCDDIQVEFDCDQIHRVIDNLIMNAKEGFFTGSHEVEEKTIWVTTTFENNHAVIRFADNGPGIQEEIRNSLFEPFTTIGKKTGTGLGLATVRNIVSAHSGKIAVESKGKEGGAVFELKFPASKF